MKMRKPVGIVLFIIAAVFGLAALVMLLWNFALVPAVNVNPLSYWQAMALLVLSKILFSSFRGGPQSKYWRKNPGWRGRWANMSPEERERFKETWKKKCDARKDTD